ncbi:MAG: phosphatidylserine/phosphatidylglycerophosphate/cardiolipin synthase family protein [Bdellovibrionales bacterium]|nr:phosphatidylserine/phosphatidylglycerophosphate/cardiolipin synthase family protein [Bdellovibrionales bacterium]
MEWVYDKGEEFFTELTSCIGKAQKFIDVEIYILEVDGVGSSIYEALLAACARGVEVRLLVDGIGSLPWIHQHFSESRPPNFFLRVFRPLPWPLSQFSVWKIIGFRHLFSTFSYINRRTHKKLCIIDDKTAFLGSFNYFDLAFIWKEFGLKYQGDGLSEIIESFNYSWRHSKLYRGVEKLLSRSSKNKFLESDQVRTNFKLKERRRNMKEFVQKIDAAKDRIWLAQAYILPPHPMYEALLHAAKRGVDVRIVTGRETDVKLIKWANILFYEEMIQAGVKIYEYLPSILHCKVSLLDNEGLVGTSNLDYRSYTRDLEIDLWIRDHEALKKTEVFLGQTYEQSQLLTKEDFKTPNIFQRLIAHFILLFKGWL